MKTESCFKVDFNYALSENIAFSLTAIVELQHSVPHYLIRNFHFKNHPSGTPLLTDMYIFAIKNEKGISWVHADSRKETMLSMAIGKAIEAKSKVELVNGQEKLHEP